MHVPSDISPSRADRIGGRLGDIEGEIRNAPGAISDRSSKVVHLEERRSYRPRKRSRLSLVLTWLPRAAPYLARILGPGLASIALMGLGTEVVLGAERGAFGEPTVPAAIVATAVGVAACILGAVGSIRQYRAQIPPSPYL